MEEFQFPFKGIFRTIQYIQDYTIYFQTSFTIKLCTWSISKILFHTINVSVIQVYKVLNDNSSILQIHDRLNVNEVQPIIYKFICLNKKDYKSQVFIIHKYFKPFLMSIKHVMWSWKCKFTFNLLVLVLPVFGEI